MSQTYFLELKSEFTEVEKVPGFVEKISNESDFGEDLKHRVMLALSEAATNAIVHGNKENKDKKVIINISIDASRVIIDIQDEGKGFDPKMTPNPIDEENLLATGGRGIFLMEEFADEVEFSDGGRLVTMRFDRRE